MEKVGCRMNLSDTEIEDLKADNVYLKSCLKRQENQIYEANLALKDIKEKLSSINLSVLIGYDREKIYEIIFTDGIIDSYLEKWGVK